MIQDIVTQIRHAIFGKDVRENIARGIETLDQNKINKPATDGQSGMLLQNNGNGSTSWTSCASPTDEQVAVAVEEWLDDHPSATTTVEDKSLTEKKFTDKLKAQTFPILNLKYKKTAVQKDVWQYNNYDFLADYSLQSMCYDSYRDRYILGFSHNTNDTYSLLMIMKEPDFDLDPSTNVISYAARTYYHCNDLAYYPGSGDGTDDRIYVVGGTSAVWILDAETLGYIDYKTISGLDTGEGVWDISVYSDGSIYLNTGDKARRYTHDFSAYATLGLYNNYYFREYFGLQDTAKVYSCSQGSFIYNDTPYMIYNVGEPVGSGWWGAYIVSFDANGLIFARKVATEYEVEAADIVGNKIVFACGQVWLNFAEAFLDVPDVSDSQITRYSIPSGADLNDYKTPGIYFSQNRGITESLSNIPVNAEWTGFTLEVMRSGYDNVRQIMYSSSFWEHSAIYIRGYAVTPKVWGPWYVLSGQKSDGDAQQLTNANMVGVTGFVTTSGTDLMMTIPFISAHEYDTITITMLKIALRCGDGYVISNGADVTQYVSSPNSSVQFKHRQGLIFISLRNDNGWGVTNNTPVNGTCDISCTFSYAS